MNNASVLALVLSISTFVACGGSSPQPRPTPPFVPQQAATCPLPGGSAIADRTQQHDLDVQQMCNDEQRRWSIRCNCQGTPPDIGCANVCVVALWDHSRPMPSAAQCRQLDALPQTTDPGEAQDRFVCVNRKARSREKGITREPAPGYNTP